MKVGAWCYDNFDILSGVSFLPKADDAHIYQEAPYETITKREYNKLMSGMEKIDWGVVKEGEDNTTSSQELACTGDACEL